MHKSALAFLCNITKEICDILQKKKKSALSANAEGALKFCYKRLVKP